MERSLGLAFLNKTVCDLDMNGPKDYWRRLGAERECASPVHFVRGLGLYPENNQKPKGICEQGTSHYFRETLFQRIWDLSKAKYASAYLHIVYQNSSNAHSVFHLVAYVMAPVVFLISSQEMDLPPSLGPLVWSVVYLSSSSPTLWAPYPTDAAALGSQK